MALIGILGIVLLLGLAFLISNDKKRVNYKAIIIMLVLQFGISLFMLKTSIGMKIVSAVSGIFEKLIIYGTEGIDFVTGGLVPEGGSIFFINVLLMIVFTATVLSVLTHLRILPFCIKYIGGLLSKVTGLPKLESFNAVNSVFFGQSEALIVMKPHLDKLHDNRLFIISTSAMASVSASIVGAYMQLIPPEYVLVAMVLNMFSALIVASIIAPVRKEDVQDEEINVKEVVQTRSVFDAISVGALDGGKVALIVGAMLIAYIGLIAMINGILMSTIGTDLQTILGYVFSPIAFILGVPATEILTAGSIMGTKIVTNEFVAMLDLVEIIDTLSAKTVGILSVFLTSFAAFSSIGIIGGTMQVVNGAKAKVVADFSLKMLLTATMASALSAVIVGIFL